MRYLYSLLTLVYLVAIISCVPPQGYWSDNMPVQQLTELTTLNRQVVETSGLSMYNNRIWTINDSGDASYIYEISRTSGNVIKKVEIKSAKNEDWELLTRDSTYLYIGDTGNNDGDRDKLVIYKLKLKDLDEAETEVTHDGKIIFSYPSGHPNYNCEAMIVVNNRLGIFTKNKRGQNTQFFTIENSIGEHEAKYLGEFDSHGLVTSASFINEKLVLLGYAKRENLQAFLWVFDSFNPEQPFSTEPVGYRLPYKLQAEAITHDLGARYLLSNEGNFHKHPTLWELSLNQ